jgi:hypothetical protein
MTESGAEAETESVKVPGALRGPEESVLPLVVGVFSHRIYGDEYLY